MRQTDEQKQRQRSRNMALLTVLGGLVVLFYALSVVRFGATG